MKKKIIVAGCDQLGLYRVQEVLTRLGLRCSLSWVYATCYDPTSEDDQKQMAELWGSQDAEVSWAAAPFLNTTSKKTIIHLVCDPAKVVADCLAEYPLGGRKAKAKFIRKYVPEVDSGSELERAVTYWVRWNEMVERAADKNAVFRVQSEDLASRLHLPLRDAGWNDVSQKSVATVVADLGKLPTPVVTSLDWDDVFICSMGRAMRQLASNYGYV